MLSRIKKIFLNYKELKHLAYHDSLTGLLNRNWLYKNINSIHRKYVYFIDLNDLKSINKNGHTCGDNYIKSTIDSISLKKTDILIRYAGDEFILFSNELEVISTNKLYSVGFCEIKNNILDAINTADKNMIYYKNLYKNNKL